MDFIKEFLANPIVGLTGYALSAIAAIIAIAQATGKTNALKENKDLNTKLLLVKKENHELRLEINKSENKNKIKQGDRSQYFQSNSGPISIDNRG